MEQSAITGNVLNSLPTAQSLIAIVEDEPDISGLVSLSLKKAGFRAKEFCDASSFLGFLKNSLPDLVILDLMLPDMDGLEICKYMQINETYSQIPIIMLTARVDEIDKLIGLEIGADDYITKPFSVRELVARVKVVLRRDEKKPNTKKLGIGGILEIDLQKYEAFVDGGQVVLTLTEFRILKLLLNRKGWVYSRSQILDYLDVKDKGVSDRNIDVHIKNLRDKLGKAGKFIKNIRGIGYKIDERD